jgi:HD domain
VAALVRHPLIDDILDARREYARGDTAAFEGYRNHAHRVYTFARSIASLSPEDQDKLAIAAAFHDLCVFDGLDYLEPSIEEAARYLRETGREEWDREVALMIASHHRVRPYRGEHAARSRPYTQGRRLARARSQSAPRAMQQGVLDATTDAGSSPAHGRERRRARRCFHDGSSGGWRLSVLACRVQI